MTPVIWAFGITIISTALESKSFSGADKSFRNARLVVTEPLASLVSQYLFSLYSFGTVSALVLIASAMSAWCSDRSGLGRRRAG